MTETIPEEVMQAARKIGENLRFELAEIQFREAAALWGKPGVIEAMTASLSSVLMAERTRQEERVRVLEEALITIRDKKHACFRAADCQAVARAALGNGGGDDR